MAMDFPTIVSLLRSKVRVDSVRGQLNIEQLFDVPLRSTKDSFSLDALAQSYAKRVRDLEVGSFVDRSSSPQLQEASLVLDLLKWVIDIKMTEENQRLKAAAMRAEEQRIMEALAKRQADKLANASEDELLVRLKELRGY